MSNRCRIVDNECMGEVLLECLCWYAQTWYDNDAMVGMHGTINYPLGLTGRDNSAPSL